MLGTSIKCTLWNFSLCESSKIFTLLSQAARIDNHEQEYITAPRQD